MSIKIIGKIKLTELKVGHFALVNGNVVYRYALDNPTEHRSFWSLLPDGVLLIEKHGYLNMIDSYGQYDADNFSGQYGLYYDIIEVPDKKHCDNAIAMIRKMSREGKINGLSYVDNLFTLKSYIKQYLEKKANEKQYSS